MLNTEAPILNEIPTKLIIFYDNEWPFMMVSGLSDSEWPFMIMSGLL